MMLYIRVKYSVMSMWRNILLERLIFNNFIQLGLNTKKKKTRKDKYVI